MDNQSWDAQLRAVLDKYITTPEVKDTVFRMYKAMHTTQRVLAGDNDASVRSAVAQMLVDLTYGIPAAPWVQLRGAGVMSAFTTAVNGYFDSLVYVGEAAETPESSQEIRHDLFIRGMATSYAMHDVALQALLADRGPGLYRRDSRAMRDALLAVVDH